MWDKNLEKKSFENNVKLIQKKITDKIEALPGITILDKVVYFEQTFDTQYQSLAKIIKKFYKKENSYKKENNIEQQKLVDYIFFLTIQNSLICYQLSGTWNNYREEFANYTIEFLSQKLQKKIEKKHFFDNLEDNNLFQNLNTKFWTEFLKSCKYNRRLKNIKLQRILKTQTLWTMLSGCFLYFYQNMEKLNDTIAKTMNQKNDSKTIVFATKMFGYVARNCYEFCSYPNNIKIPIDSRVERFYTQQTWNQKYTKKDILDTIFEVSKNLWVPSLHLDCVIWV